MAQVWCVLCFHQAQHRLSVLVGCVPLRHFNHIISQRKHICNTKTHYSRKGKNMFHVYLTKDFAHKYRIKDILYVLSVYLDI